MVASPSLTLNRRAWLPRGVTLVLGGLCAASVTYGWLAWPQPYVLPPPAVDAAPTPVTDGDVLLRWLDGSTSTPALAPNASGRLVLVGVVGGPGPDGAALIAVDGQPAKAFRVGVTVVDGLVLRSVLGRQAVLGPEGAGEQDAFTLELNVSVPTTPPAPPVDLGPPLRPTVNRHLPN